MSISVKGKRLRKRLPRAIVSVDRELTIRALPFGSWQVPIATIEEAQLVQLPAWRGLRVRVLNDDWFFWTYEGGHLAVALASRGVHVVRGVQRFRLRDLP